MVIPPGYFIVSSIPMKSTQKLMLGGLALTATAITALALQPVAADEKKPASPAQPAAADNPAAATTGSDFSPYVDAEGNISLPQDYRSTFLHLGTFSVASTDKMEAAELHNVYTRQQDWTAYKRDGKWPDGAIIVKDVYEAQAEDLTTGRSSWASKIKVWFVMVKDTTKRFPDNEIWGDGWGWGLFEGKDPTKQVSEDYRSDCRTCHVPAKRTDWLYLDRLPSP